MMFKFHYLKQLFHISTLCLIISLLAACKGGDSRINIAPEGDTIPLTYARNLTLIKGDGYVKAELRNPWDTTKNLHTYIMIPDSLPIPENLPEGTVVRTPLKNSIVYSSVHQSLIDELGALEAISGVMDVSYVRDRKMLQKIEAGEVEDCGSNTVPNLERIVKMNPDGILISPYEDSGSYGKLGQLGIPLIECADYMEYTPLGRAEWIKFYGLLYGKSQEADLIFQNTEKEYNSLKNRAANLSAKPKVLTDLLYGQSWSMPGAESSMGIFIIDAGGVNPFTDYKGKSNVQVSAEQVLHKMGDADIWLLRYWQDSEKTKKELADDNPVYSHFKPFNEDKIWGCNTKDVAFYEDVPFHPQWLLAELITLFHPEVDSINVSKRFFTPLN